MNDDPQEELISAYLDGELSADEQRQVERLLADSAEYRQLYEELRSLRASFEALPRYRLPEDLSQRVLRRAEQELLRDKSGVGQPEQSNPDRANFDRPAFAAATRALDSAAADDAACPASTPGAGDKRVPDSSQGERSWPYPRTWRTIFWPVMVVAAAVAMMVAGPKQRVVERSREIARAPAVPNDAASKDAATWHQPPAEIGAAPTERSSLDDESDHESDLANSLPDGAPAEPAADRRQETQLGTAAPAARSLAKSEKSAQPADGARRKSAALAEQLADDENEVAGTADDKPADVKQAPSRDAVPAAPPVAGLAGRATRGFGKGPAPQNGPVSDTADSTDALAAPAAGPVAAFGAAAGVIDSGNANGVGGEDANGTGRADAYVIDVQLTPEAVRQQAFEQLLARNQLAELPTDLAPDADENGQPQRRPADLADKQAKGDGKSLSAAAAKPLDAEQQPPAKPQATAAQPPLAQGAVAQNALAPSADNDSAVREVTVAATPEQFVATLHDLRQHPQQFSISTFGIAPTERSALTGARGLQAEAQAAGDRTAIDGAADQPGAGEDLDQSAGKKQPLAKGQLKPNDELRRGEVAKDKIAAKRNSVEGSLGDRISGGKGASPNAAAEKAKRAARVDEAAKQLDEVKPGQAKSDSEKSRQLRANAQGSSGSPAPGSPAPGSSAGQGGGGASSSGGVQFRNREGNVQLHLAPAQAAGRAAPGASAAPVPSAINAQNAAGRGAVPPATLEESQVQTGQTVKLIFRLRVAESAAETPAGQALPAEPAVKPAP